MRRARYLFLLFPLLGGCSGDTEITGEGRYLAEVWTDNWFALYVGDTLVMEDSVPITTERSFNAERFAFDAEYPMVLNFILKDYMEDDTGLEYIGEENQQMGDGGAIFQITDTETGTVIAVSNASWKCDVIHTAPTNKDCEKDSNPEETCLSEIEAEPDGWKDADYDVSGWESATEYEEAAIDPKEGYYDIDWSSDAKLIWTSDLETDNILLCKLTLSS